MTGLRAFAGLAILTAVAVGCTPAPSSGPVVVAQESTPIPADPTPAPASASVPGSIDLPEIPQPVPPAPPAEAPQPEPPPPAQPPPANPQDQRPGGPQQLNLAIGQTARLRYFDVTVRQAAYGQDGISVGWKVEVCYRAPHPGANTDGTTRISTNPWSARVVDGEVGGPAEEIALDRFPRDNAWSPPYRTRQIRLGECEFGWIGIRHDNPDLQWPAVIYQPRDFGDRIVWAWN